MITHLMLYSFFDQKSQFGLAQPWIYAHLLIKMEIFYSVK